MVVRIGFSVCLLLVLSCTDLTEFDTTYSAGVTVLSTEDLSSIGSISGIPGARSICTTPENLLVATTDGILEAYDIVTFQHMGSYSVGNPSPSGYFFMERNPYENTVYLIGALGQIIELSVSLNILDVFSVCESPMAIEFLPEAPFMYVADYSGSRILELRVETNGITRTCGIPANPVCLAVDGDMDTMLVGTTGATELLAVGGSGPIYKRTMSNYPALLAAQAIPNDTTLCLVFNGTDDHLSVLYHYFPPYGSPQLWVNLGNLPGDSHFLALNETGSRAFVLSPDQAGNSLLQSFDLDSLELLDSVTVPGFPMDLTCGEEAVFALTIE